MLDPGKLRFDTAGQPIAGVDALDERERRWLRPLDPLSRGLSLAIYWLNRGLIRGLFGLRISRRENLPNADLSSSPRTTRVCSTPSPSPPN